MAKGSFTVSEHSPEKICINYKEGRSNFTKEKLGRNIVPGHFPQS